MPIYEYRCPNCGEKFDKLVRFGGDAQVRCPNCDSDQARRLISLVAHTISGANSGSTASTACATST
jgi:putative FmdB family regulatory protein